MVDDCLNRVSRARQPSRESALIRIPYQKARKDYSQEAFELTNRILDFNPEFYTIWNYRRLILLEGLFIDAYVAVEQQRLCCMLT